MDWRNRRYFLIKGINSLEKEQQVWNLRNIAKVKLHTRPEMMSPKLIPNTIRKSSKNGYYQSVIFKDEHIPRGFYNYMVGCFIQDAKTVLDYFEKHNFNFKEIKQYKSNKMVNRKTWEEFRANGLLLFINQILHIFGWSICYDFDQETGELKSVYPARVRFRGFNETAVSEAYKNLSKYIINNAEDLYMESRE